MTLFEYLTTRTHDTDVYVDGLGGIAFCPESLQLTPAGIQEFKRCFDLKMDGDTAMGEEKDYDRRTAAGTLKLIVKLGFRISADGGR